MEKIASFTIDHIKLQPGLYVSRKDRIGAETVTTFDLRLTSPNEEPVLNTAEAGETFNICSGKSYTIRELVEMLIDIADVSVDFRFDSKYERVNDIPLLIGDPTKMTNLGWKPMISIEDSLTDLFNEMVIRRRTELKMGLGKDLPL